jgi:hypothetical protein
MAYSCYSATCNFATLHNNCDGLTYDANCGQDGQMQVASPQTYHYIRLTPQYKNAVFHALAISRCHDASNYISTGSTQEDFMDSIRNIINGKKA